MKNVTLDRSPLLQLDADGTDSALDAAADRHVLRNDIALDLSTIANQEIGGAQFTFDSAKDLRCTLHSTLPTIDISEPMQEAAPDFVVVLPCGCTILSMASSSLFSFSGALLFKLPNMSTSRSSGASRHRAPYQGYHVWSDAAFKNSRHL
jgi:hypothetical protein